MKFTVFVFLLLVTQFASAAPFKSDKISSACNKSFAADMGSKTKNFCTCYTKNMVLLISSDQTNTIISWLENKMSKADQSKNQALLDMEYIITDECNKDSNWISEKAQAIIDSLKEKNK